MRRTIAILILSLAQPGVAAPQRQVVDRIVVRIEDDILTLSEMREMEGFQQLLNGPSPPPGGPASKNSEQDSINRLIDQWIVQAEATTSRFPQPAPEDVKRAIERLEKQFASPEAYRMRLRELALTAESVARQMERQLYLAGYIDYKFRPVAQFDQAQVEKYYEQELIPELRKRAQKAPPLENVEPQIRELLTQREISRRAAQWLEETRLRLKIDFLEKGKAS